MNRLLHLKTALRIIAIVPLFSAVALGCAAEQEEDTANAGGQVGAAAFEPLTLFEEHDGGRFEAREGQPIDVHVPVLQGHDWEVVDDGGLGKPMFTAGSGSVIMTWRAKKTTATLKLALMDARSKAVRTLSFTIVVERSTVTCPPQRTIKCGPTTGSVPAECARDKREALEKECGVRFLF